MKLKKTFFVTQLLIWPAITAGFLSSCSTISNKIIGDPQNVDYINSLTVSIKYDFSDDQTLQSGTVFGTGWVFDNDLSNDDPNNNLKTYYIATNSHVLASGYNIQEKIIEEPNSQNPNKPVLKLEKYLKSTISKLWLGYSPDLNYPQNINYIQMYRRGQTINANSDIQVMGLGVDLVNDYWRDIEILKVSAPKNIIYEIPAFRNYDAIKNQLNFTNGKLAEYSNITAVGYPYDTKIHSPILTSGSGPFSHVWYMNSNKHYRKSNINFKYNSIDWDAEELNLGAGSSGSMSCSDDKTIIGNYWGVLSATNNKNEKLTFGMVTPWKANLKKMDLSLDNGLTLSFMNFKDSPVVVPSKSDLVIDLNGAYTFEQFKQFNYDNLINFLNSYKRTIYESKLIQQNPSDYEQDKLAFSEFNKIKIIKSLESNKIKNIPINQVFKNASINQDVIRDWKELLASKGIKTRLNNI